jgi:putative ABC transport system permease protein
VFAYYLKLGVRHLRRNPVLTALIVVTIGVGVAASMTVLTVLHTMSADPIPHKSDRLFVPLMDIRPDDGSDLDAADLPPMLSYRDAVALRAAGGAKRRSALLGVAPAVDSGRADVPPFFADSVAVDADFFAMFEVPFVKGGAWSTEDDTRGAHVVVLRESMASRVLGDVIDPIGKTVRMNERDFVVVGVVADDWKPLPKYYRLVGSARFDGFELAFLPFTTAIADEMRANGQMSCYGEKGSGVGWQALLESDCIWVMYWVELASAADAPGYRSLMAGYVGEQQKLGRLPRGRNLALLDVPAWLEKRGVVANEARLHVYLALSFLLVCLINTIGLLLAKFTARAGEIGVRRALGASRPTLFFQYLTETAVVGVAGGVVGLLLTLFCLWLMRGRSPELANLARLDGVMLVTTFAIAAGATLLAGLLPTWRACQTRPAVMLKSQ